MWLVTINRDRHFLRSFRFRAYRVGRPLSCSHFHSMDLLHFDEREGVPKVGGLVVGFGDAGALAASFTMQVWP